jgi:hypothetical protein
MNGFGPGFGGVMLSLHFEMEEGRRIHDELSSI